MALYTYRHKITGQEILVPCPVYGDWEPVTIPASEEPKKEKAPAKPATKVKASTSKNRKTARKE